MSIPALEVTDFLADAVSGFAELNGLPKLKRIFENVGLTSTAIENGLKDHPFEAAAAMLVGMATVIALGPEIAATGELVAMGAAMTPVLEGVMAQTAIEAFISAAASTFVGNQAASTYTNILNAFEQIIDNMGGSTNSTNPNLIITPPNPSTDLAPIAISLPVLTQDANMVVVFTSNGADTPAPAPTNVDSSTGSTITFNDGDGVTRTGTVLYRTTDGHYVTNNINPPINEPGSGLLAVGPSLVISLTPPQQGSLGSQLNVIVGDTSINSDGSVTTSSFDVTDSTAESLTDNENSSGQITGGNGSTTVINQNGGSLVSTVTSTDAFANVTQTTYYFLNGRSITLDAATATGISFNASTNTLTATLLVKGIAVGTLSLNASGGGTVTLSTGATWQSAQNETITLPATTGNLHLVAPTSGTSTIQILSNYLTALGDSLTAGQLDQANYSFLDPATSSTTVTGTVAGSGSQTTDTFVASTNNVTANGPTSVTVNGAQVTPTNILQTNGSNIAQDTLTNIQKLNIADGSPFTKGIILSASEFNSFQQIISTSGFGIAVMKDSGSYSMSGKVDPNSGLILAAGSWLGTTLTGWALGASMYGNDTLIGSIPSNLQFAKLYSGKGVDNLQGSSTGNTQFNIPYGLAAGSTVTASGNNNTLFVTGDISAATITGVQTLSAGFQQQNLTLTASQFSSFNQVTSSNSTGLTLNVRGGGTVSLLASNVNSNAFGTGTTVKALTNEGTTLIGNNSASETLVASQSGNDTLQAGNGNNVVLTAGSGDDVLIAGTGTETLNGGGGYASYTFGSTFAQDVINNANGGSSVFGGEIDFAAGISLENLWLARNGNDLVITKLGTNDTIRVSGWFGNNLGAQITAINTADGLSLNNLQVAALVSAMATYQSNNSGFNPTTATQMPSDSVLQTALANAWTDKQYTSATTNADGSWTGIITDNAGGVWTSITDHYSAANILTSTVELFNNGSSVTTTYSTTGGNNTYSVSGTLPSGADIVLPSGNNQLTLGNVTGETVDGSFSNGNNILTIQDILSNNPGANYNNTLDVANSAGNNSLTVGDGSYDLLRVDFSSGNNTLIAGNGSHDWLDAESSHGANSLTVGSGADNTLDVSFSTGNNTLTAMTGSSDYLNAQNTIGNNILRAGDGVSETLSVAFSSGANTLIAGNGNGDYLNVESSSGNNVLTAGNGNNDELDALWATGQNTFNVGTGNTVLFGGKGATTYKFGSTFGQDTLYNGGSSYGTGASATQGEVDFGVSETSQNLWFTQSGSDLVVRLLGTSDTITVKGWFGSNAGAQVQAFYVSNGFKLSNTAVAALVTAMANYQTTHSTFNPATATAMPTDTTLQSAISSAWMRYYDSTTTNADGSWAGTLNDRFNGNWQYIKDYYTSANALKESYELFNDGTATDTAKISGITLTSNDTVGETLNTSSAGGDTVNVAAGSQYTVNATDAGSDVINAGSGNTVNINNNGGTQEDWIGISGGTVHLLDHSWADIYGGSNTITVGQNAVIGVQSGNNNNLTVGNGSYVYVNGGTGDTITSSGATIFEAVGVSMSVIGEGNVIYAANGSTMSIVGNGDYAHDDYVSASNSTITIADNSRVDVYGGGNTIIAGQNDVIGVQNGNGNSVTIGGNGSIYINSGNSDTIYASNETVYAQSGVTVTVSGGNDIVYAANGDTVNITGNGQYGADNYVVQSSGTVTVANNAHADVYGGGNNVTVGQNALLGIQYGNNNAITMGSNSQIYVNDSSTETINGGGNDQYNFASTFGQDTINNGTALTTANGSVGFGSGITDENLWFKHVDNNLEIDLVGTSDKITISNWYGTNAGAQVQGFYAGGLILDAQVAQLVSAMATYVASTGFNPTASGATIPSGSSSTAAQTLQNAIAASWHH